MKILQIPAFSDNYFWLLHENNSKYAVAVDPGDYSPIIKSLEENNLELSDILVTHHHNDHIGGILELKKKFPNINIYGPSDSRIPTTITVKDKDLIKLDSLKETFEVLNVKGHTNSHIAYYFKNKFFCGDTLFSCGCGRIFEGTYIDMHKAMAKIKKLPKETLIYCAHEYTLNNIGFAKLVDPYNLDLILRENQVKKLLSKNLFSVPSVLKNELKTNPFLRYDNVNIKNSIESHFNISLESEVEVFKYTRLWKDQEYD